MLIGVDIGGTKTAVLITDLAGSELARLTQPTDPSDLVPAVIRTIRAAVSLVESPQTKLFAIGVGVPGLVDPAQGDVLLAVNLQIDGRVPLAAPLTAAFGVPVYLENDVRLAALGAFQYWQIDNLAYFSIGTGVAAGVVLDGAVHRGVNGLAGEIGHVPLVDDDLILEAYIAGPGIVRQGIDAGLEVTHAGNVYQLAQAGNPQALGIVERVSQLITLAVHWLIFTYDVDAVVFGGGVTAAQDAFLAPILASMAERRSRSALNAQLLGDEKIKLMPPHINAGLWGGVQLARQHMDRRSITDS